MKTIKTLSSLCLVLLLTFSVVSAEDDEAIDRYSLWIGSHYTEFSDYTKKIGEYNIGDNEWMPEFKLGVYSQSGNSIFRLDGHYYDDKNIFGDVRTTVGDRFKFKAKYRSLIHQKGQDMLTNISAREFLPSNGLPGGKILTHELLDPDADYNYKRQEILTELEMLLSKKNNVRLSAVHRTILKDGQEQAIASNHCFSCHLTSETADVEQRQHQVEVGLDAEVGKADVGYLFAYRTFQSNADDPVAYYDPAKHPVNGGAGAEFSSRQVYDDTNLVYSALPKTEKTSHKVRFKSDVGEGTFSSSLSYSRAENKNVELTTDAVVGAVNYAVRLSDRTRLVAKGSQSMLKADDPFIDLPTFRDGAADLNETSFDFQRLSSLDRWESRIQAEVISRINPRMTLYVLGGYDRIDRDDYPVKDNGTITNKIIGQAKLRYRKGLRYSSLLKYRFEKTSDPFLSARGLFEMPGNETLEPLVPISNWIFYFQREDLRYQDITTVPTDKHVFDWNSSYRPSGRYSLNLGVKGQYDKNGNLDSLDVKHFSLQPNINLNYTPDMKWTLATGYTYSYDKSKLPVTVAMFDG